jgi:predicted enzyme related to lactoylglutathione lyase
MVNGFGGIFIKASDPKFLARWYEDRLGINFGATVYTTFNWKDPSDQRMCHTDLSFMADDTTYFYPSDQQAMINLRVNDLDSLRIRMQSDRQQVIEKVEVYDYGRFGWVVDPEGNKIELWEPPAEMHPDFSSARLEGPVTGIGGFFIQCVNPSVLSEGYSKYFGLFFDHSAHTFQWIDPRDNSEAKTVFSFFPLNSSYFAPSSKQYMINFRVKELDRLLKKLREEEVEITGNTEVYEYGKFAWLLDPEGNKVELWEPL